MVWTGSSNATMVLGGAPCEHCGARHRLTTRFHGYWLTLCVACGEEL